jgi:hypothetical protein
MPTARAATSVLYEQGRENVLCDEPGRVLREQRYNDPEGYSNVWKVREEVF